MIVEKRQRILSPPDPERGEAAKQVSPEDLKRHDAERSPFEQGVKLRGNAAAPVNEKDGRVHAEREKRAKATEERECRRQLEEKKQEEALRNSIAAIEKEEKRGRRLLAAALLLLIPAFCAVLAIMGKNDTVWMMITVCALSFALLALALKLLANDNGGGAAAVITVADGLMLFPLIVFGSVENWAWILAALILFNIIYAVVWRQAFHAVNEKLDPLRKKKEQLQEELRIRQKLEKTIIKREPMDEAAVTAYTAKMEEAYDRLVKDRFSLYPAFPWSAVFGPEMMRDILLCRTTVTDDLSDSERRYANLGRFKLSIQAYDRYGVRPTTELVDYIRENHMDPDLDDALADYRRVHE